MEGGRREGGGKRNKNVALLCSCRKPARVVIVPTSWVPGQRCWRCATAQCDFVLWDGPWVNPQSIAQMNEWDGEDQPPQAAAAPPDSTATGSSSSTVDTANESKNKQDKSVTK